MQFIEAGRAACQSLFAVIDRKPDISIDASGIEVLQAGSTNLPGPSMLCFPLSFMSLLMVVVLQLQLKGDIELENINFAYPTRPDRPVFNGFNLIIPAGTKPMISV